MRKIDTRELVDRLSADARPAAPLRSPGLRLLGWLSASVAWIALVVYLMGPRPDLAAKAADFRWLIEQAAAATTGVTAAIAAFCSVVPGRPRWERLMPAVPLAVWVSVVGVGCVADWFGGGFDGSGFTPDWACFPGIAMVGLVPAVLMAIMLRRGAPLSPMYSVGLGGLAAAALGDFGLRLFHPTDAGLMVLVWQMGAVATLTLAYASLSRGLLQWRHARAR